MSDTTTIKVNSSTHQKVLEYKKSSGVSIQRIYEDAINQFLENKVEPKKVKIASIRKPVAR